VLALGVLPAWRTIRELARQPLKRPAGERLGCVTLSLAPEKRTTPSCAFLRARRAQTRHPSCFALDPGLQNGALRRRAGARCYGTFSRSFASGFAPTTLLR
jgi:hypothetical protein